MVMGKNNVAFCFYLFKFRSRYWANSVWTMKSLSVSLLSQFCIDHEKSFRLFTEPVLYGPWRGFLAEKCVYVLDRALSPAISPCSCLLPLVYHWLPPLAAAAVSLQSCPTLCDPRDSSPPGSSVPGILQARTLEWVAISFSNEWKWKVKMKSLSRVRLLATPWTLSTGPWLNITHLRKTWFHIPFSNCCVPCFPSMKKFETVSWLQVYVSPSLLSSLLWVFISTTPLNRS